MPAQVEEVGGVREEEEEEEEGGVVGVEEDQVPPVSTLLPDLSHNSNRSNNRVG